MITFFDLNTIDVDTLIIPYVAANQDNKTVKRLSRFLSTNISDVIKDVPLGTIKELKKNLKVDIDSVLIFKHT